MRHHMVDGHFVAAHVEGNKNNADMLTKNGDGKTHTRHATGVRDGLNVIWVEWPRAQEAIG